MKKELIVHRTTLDVYIKETALLVKQLEKRKDEIVDAHASFGPSSSVSNQTLGQWYYTISRLMYECDRVGSAFRDYIEYLEKEYIAAGGDLEKEAGRLRKMMDEHHVKLAGSKTKIKERMKEMKDFLGLEEDFLKLVGKKFAEQTNFIMHLKNMMSLYFDYVEFLETRVEVPEDMKFTTVESINHTKDIFLILEKHFEFEIEKPCPKCKEMITLSPQAPRFICPFCGHNIGVS